MKRNKQAWKKWHDPNATEEDYKRWRDDHHARVRKAAEQLVKDAIRQTNGSGVTEQAMAVGLSPGTIRKYRTGFGKRGPMLVTFLQMRGHA